MLRLVIAVAWLLLGLAAAALFGVAAAWAYPLGRDTSWSVAWMAMALWAAIEVPALARAIDGVRHGRR